MKWYTPIVFAVMFVCTLLLVIRCAQAEEVTFDWKPVAVCALPAMAAPAVFNESTTRGYEMDKFIHAGGSCVAFNVCDQKLGSTNKSKVLCATGVLGLGLFKELIVDKEFGVKDMGANALGVMFPVLTLKF